jgi:hypothetical protein
MNNKKLLNLKEEYEQIEVPSELNAVIQMGIDKGREEMKEKNKYVNVALKICASFILTLTLLTGVINTSSSFADALRSIPVVGKLVNVLQFTEGKSSGGVITDGTDISQMELIEDDVYEDIVISFSQSNELQTDAGAFKVRYEENPYTMSFEIGGVRSISAKENFEKILESKYVKDVYTIITLDDSLIRFVIEFKGPVEYEVKEIKEPASIVISLKEDKLFIEKTMYSLRTKSYPYGESLGILEEKLGAINPTRILKDAQGMYFVELQLFKFKEEASSGFEEISELNHVSLLIEERFGIESPNSYPVETESEVINESKGESQVEFNGEENFIKESLLYPVSIKENDEYYYGNIEMLEKGLNIYNEDIETEIEHYFQYEDITLTKLRGEASFKLKIEGNDKVIIASGVFSDFFEKLSEYVEIEE